MTGLFAGLLPAAVRVAELDPADDLTGAIDAAERAVVEETLPRRRREFAAGRYLARRLLTDLGAASGPLLPRSDRSPAWPDGIVGSITHCPTRVAVAVARSEDVEALGIDVEPQAPLPDGLERRVLSTAEARAMDGLPGGERALRGRGVFSAKEATYKAIYPLTGLFLGFHDVAVSWAAGGEFEALLGRDAPPFPAGTRFAGRHAADSMHVATSVVIPRPGGAAGL